MSAELAIFLWSTRTLLGRRQCTEIASTPNAVPCKCTCTTINNFISNVSTSMFTSLPVRAEFQYEDSVLQVLDPRDSAEDQAPDCSAGGETEGRSLRVTRSRGLHSALSLYSVVCFCIPVA